MYDGKAPGKADGESRGTRGENSGYTRETHPWGRVDNSPFG